VDDVMRYWGDPPPEPSARCLYWQRRFREGTWKPNKYLARQGYHSSAIRLGIFIWEWRYVMAPLLYYREAPARPIGV
jgi:hypothetical protein